MNSQVLPIVAVTDTSGKTFFVNVYQIVCISKIDDYEFNLRVNNHATIVCKGNAEDFLYKIRKS